jgi:hypothetical protein
MNEVLTKKGIPVVPKPPYYVRVTSSFSLKLKFHLRGCRFLTVDNIQVVVTDQLMALPQEFFQHLYRECN